MSWVMPPGIAARARTAGPGAARRSARPGRGRGRRPRIDPHDGADARRQSAALRESRTNVAHADLVAAVADADGDGSIAIGRASVDRASGATRASNRPPAVQAGLADPATTKELV